MAQSGPQQYHWDLTVGLVGILLVQREDADHLGPDRLSFDGGRQASLAGEASARTWPPRPRSAWSAARRSYLSTAAKHGKHFFDILVMLTEGRPWLPATH